MKILNAIARAFHQGCGILLEKATKLPRFAELMAQQESLNERFPVTTDQGIALRAGHLTMGKLLNTLDEPTAVTMAKDQLEQNVPPNTLRPLVQLLGEQLIEAASNCLPESIKELAVSWEHATADEQLEITRTLYLLLISERQKSKGDLTMESLLESRMSHSEANHHADEKVLPHQYGIWNAQSNIANCQGKTQLILAFAKLAGAQALVFHPITQAGEILQEWRVELESKMITDIKKRNLICPEDFLESTWASNIENTCRQMDKAFHVCPILRLHDGRWVLIDSHALNWGVLSEHWNIEQKLNVLNKYREVLPGMSLIGSDQVTPKQVHKRVLEEFDQTIERSRTLEKALGSPENPIELVYALEKQKDEMEFIINCFRPEDPISLDSREACSIAAMTLVVGDNFLDMGYMLEIAMDPTFIQKRMGSLLTSHHAIAINKVRNQITDNGELIHPQGEFALPEYHTAISVINSLIEQSCPETNGFFMQNSFNQLVLFNALLEITSFSREAKDTGLGVAAAEVLRTLPILHPLAKWRLSMVSDNK